MTLNAFGRALRRFRIDHGLALKDMALHLRVSSAYLSALEHGRKTVTPDLEKRLLSVFPFTEEERREILRGIDLSRTEVTVRTGDDPLFRLAAGALQRNLGRLGKERKKALLSLLTGA